MLNKYLDSSARGLAALVAAAVLASTGSQLAIAQPGMQPSSIVGQTANDTAATDAVARLDGPLLSVSSDGKTSTVRVDGRGDARSSKVTENRQMSHSNLQPTGRFVKSGQQLAITVPEDSPALQVGIGLEGPYSAYNGGAAVGVKLAELKAGEQTITADRDGIVFLTNISTTAGAKVTVSGGSRLPVWVQGESTQAGFEADFKTLSDAPFATVIGEHYFADFQRRTVEKVQADKKLNLQKTVAELDQVWGWTNEVYGLSEKAVGTAYKTPSRIYISSPDSGAGLAYATEGKLSFQVSTGAAARLLSGNGTWAIWHETGHTYQTTQYKGSNLTEVTVNISALAIQGKIDPLHPRMDQDAEAIKKYLGLSAVEKDYTAASQMVQLGLFDGLRRAFGPNFYPSLSQAYRVDNALGVSQPKDDAEKWNLFALKTSKVANRDLTPYFTAWGIELTDQTKNALKAYPALKNEIWKNVLAKDTVVENSVPTYDVPTGKISYTGGTVSLGQTSSANITVSALSTIAGGTSKVVRTGILTTKVGVRAGIAYAVIENPSGVQEVISTPVDVNAGQALEFHGYASLYRGYLALSANSAFSAYGNASQANALYPHIEYYTAELRGADGKTVYRASVKGDETIASLVAAFNGKSYSNGQYLIVTSKEPSRIYRYNDTNTPIKNASTTQIFKITDNKLVPATSAPSSN
ncbi:M60 family metallopeptidase [Psychromicrobium lacuslunae]|uniref:Peptidase M60 domain-containing protein n=1 Tax=Psychromicrobium lacuslunae TaxID=1618207 RepID=A0A0D4C130_9MICC|nr:M60 family metallopeptidase [Psychromicrobium lacuslunae]AJT42100.1 hypothetical protein UM93_12365 [Psychromicrobium lacuslunae]